MVVDRVQLIEIIPSGQPDAAVGDTHETIIGGDPLTVVTER